jgi:hypothetical protein
VSKSRLRYSDVIATLRYGVCYALRPKLPAELYISLVGTLFPTRDRDSEQHKRETDRQDDARY